MHVKSVQSSNVLPLVPIREFVAVAGGEARLPCNIAIPKEPDIISLILWYREAPKSPIYTLDFRKGLPDDAKHFPGKSLTGRGHFETNEYPPTLKIDPTYVEDEGVYKCRIEYRRSRTVTRPVKLIIIGNNVFKNSRVTKTRPNVERKIAEFLKMPDYLENEIKKD
ncbi:ig-like domain-containing protein [Trichonephila clavipes]|nr:ig-like domain-containing protein [Trichonephila clavipes]